MVRSYFGLEYECPRGHRFFCSGPEKILKSTPGSCPVAVSKVHTGPDAHLILSLVVCGGHSTALRLFFLFLSPYLLFPRPFPYPQPLISSSHLPHPYIFPSVPASSHLSDSPQTLAHLWSPYCHSTLWSKVFYLLLFPICQPGQFP